MRNPNRIPICLNYLMNNNLFKFLGNNATGVIVNKIVDNYDLIKKTWNEYPDLRFGQLLCNLRLIPDIDIENHIWNVEEDDWLINNNYCKLEDIKFWGSIYDEHNHKRSKIKYILLKDLDITHIKGIIKWFTANDALKQINSKYLEYFDKRINS